KKCILFFLVIMASASLKAQEKEMKLINYNVLHGFNNDSTLENRFIGWAKKQNADIFTFQELNGFTPDRLEELAEKYGHPYAVINTGVTHPIAITSRYPIVMVQHVTTNMWHSYLYGNINGVHVFVTHLSPFEVKRRRADIERILAHVRLLPSADKVLIAGDFNALAAADSTHYGEKLTTAMQKSEGRLEPKSGLPIVKGRTIYRNNMDNGKIDYTVTNKMTEAGFYDSFYLKNKAFKHSVPTEAHKAEGAILRRIDYVWVNESLAKTVISSDVIHEEDTNQLSDHYPVTLTFKLK
ncbi:MAG: endonuclease/exonuclease/phosphatase family protein, partial [Leadbetterella sp.]|nr:endonuclease/exonuclease/phosphatase family protein [Leadbetterella sp.]